MGILQSKGYCMTIQESTHKAIVALPKKTLLKLLAKANTFSLEFACFFTFYAKQQLPSATLPK